MLPEIGKENQASVSWKSSEECVSVSWTDGLCKMVVKKKQDEGGRITTVFSNMEIVGDLSISVKGWEEKPNLNRL